ncbi:endonuclease-reverse transcriptase [Lasius niger]|uniref:Endonuclease-reverse transcriptase n=1 Tax=Lasius niger TaxID=67767 RepID=A0A0J7KZE8_LASNI|nr:endonuclease-reverse transcriptase [Lasius niger]
MRREKMKNKEWMTDEILQMMDQRRSLKNKDKEKYEELDRKIKKEVKAAKKEWMKGKCKEIEELQDKHDHTNVHRKIREVTDKRKQKTTAFLLDNDGNLAVEVEEKLAIWKAYIEELFRDERGDKPDIDCVTGSSILESEVRKALERSKNGKATGSDDVPVEILKVMGDTSIKKLTELFNAIYDSGTIPEDWLLSTFATLPKKPTAKTCEEFRTISLMSHVLKLFLKIIHAKIYRKCEENTSETQFGFRNSLGTREALFAMQVLIQRCRNMNCDVFACFIDYTKAFDRCQHQKIILDLRRVGVDDKDIRVIANLYWNQRARVRVEDRLTEQVEIHRGVRQGCVLSPTLFNIYSEEIFAEALTDLEVGIRINEEYLNNIRYADETVLLATNLKDLQLLVNRVRAASETYGLELNTKKTKFMVISRTEAPGALMVGNEKIERVDTFVYLGSVLNARWDPAVEIKSRIEIARSTFTKMRPLLCCRDLSLTTKLRIVKCYVYSVLLYGAEAWTLTQASEKEIDAFEMWIYRRLMRISWVNHMTNAEVLQRIGQEKEILNTIKQRKLEYFGHVMRNKERYRILQLVIEGRIFEKKSPGRRVISWLGNLRQWFGLSSNELFRRAVNKSMIALMIANIRTG